MQYILFEQFGCLQQSLSSQSTIPSVQIDAKEMDFKYHIENTCISPTWMFFSSPLQHIRLGEQIRVYKNKLATQPNKFLAIIDQTALEFHNHINDFHLPHIRKRRKKR